MFTALLTSPTFATFLLTSVALAITPGPAVLYLLARTLQSGRGAGLASIAGVAVGNLGNATMASLGLAVVIAQSAAAFALVKWIGAAYLMYLGIQALRARPAMVAASTPDEGTPVQADRSDAADDARAASIASARPARVTALRVGRMTPVSRGRLFRDGFWVALLNPKTALFFAALLPQFIVPGAAPLQQTWLLGCIFVAVAMCTDTAYLLAAAAIAPRLRNRSTRRPYGRYLSAATFFGLGLYAAVGGPRSTPQPLH